jgi:hypothetical protein
MIRYCKQRDSYSCAAIAVLNLLKWQDLKFTYRDLPTIRKQLKTVPGTGTSLYQIIPFFVKNSYRIKYKFIYSKFTTSHCKRKQIEISKLYNQINRGLLNNKIYYLSYTQPWSHIYLLIKTDAKYFYAINCYLKETISKIPYQRMYHLLKQTDLVIEVTK